jgi:hypothetical protein
MGGAVGGACGVRPLVVVGTGCPGEWRGNRTERQTVQMTTDAVLFLMDEGRQNGFVFVIMSKCSTKSHFIASSIPKTGREERV